MNDTTLENMIQAFVTCEGHMEMYRGFADLGIDFMRVQIHDLAMDCGLSEAATATLPDPETCMGGAHMVVMRPDRSCPKACNEGGEDDGIPACQPGQPERSPASCRTEECGDSLEAITDDMMNRSMQGLASCLEGPVALQPYATYATMMEGEYLKGVLRSWAADCGMESRLALTPPPLNTCAGAYPKVSAFDRVCPKQCDSDPEEDSPLRSCADEEEERSPRSCGVPRCQNLIAELRGGMDDFVMGLESCASVDGAGHLASYASMAEMWVRSLAGSCGFDFDTVDFTDIVDTTPPPTQRCTAISRQAYAAAVASGFQPSECG